MVFCDDAGMLTAAVVAGVADFLGAAATYGDVGVMCRAVAAYTVGTTAAIASRAV